MDVCRKYAPVVEKFSIDECFLDMSGTQRLYPNPSAIAMRMKNEIRDTLGFTVNIGIGPNKIFAKMASDFEKPDQIHTLFSVRFLKSFGLCRFGRFFTVGRTAQRLEKRRNIHHWRPGSRKYCLCPDADRQKAWTAVA